MRLKICGLTREEDAFYAEAGGAWALGFIFYQKSPRYIQPAMADGIIKGLKPQTLPIGVFVNQVDEAVSIAADIGLKGIQLHGAETPADCIKVRQSFSGLIIKAFHPGSESDLEKISGYKGLIDYILIDAAVAGHWGGTGQKADWSLLRKLESHGMPFVVAGGIGADNIAEAWKQLKPFALDLSSSVETAPGIKDKNKMQRLFDTAKEINTREINTKEINK